MTWSHFLVKLSWSLHNATRRIVHEQQHTRGQLNTECVRCNATAKTRFFFPDDASSAKFECKVVLHGDKILKWFKINAQPFVFAVVVTIITSYWRNIFTHTLTHNHPSPFTFGMLSRGQTPRENFFLPSTLSCKLTRKSKISFLFKKNHVVYWMLAATFRPHFMVANLDEGRNLTEHDPTRAGTWNFWACRVDGSAMQCPSAAPKAFIVPSSLFSSGLRSVVHSGQLAGLAANNRVFIVSQVFFRL